MDKLFLHIINMSITSGYIILFIIAARFFLKKAPKIFSYGLWGIAFLRLIFPFSLQSIFSLVSINTKTIPDNIAYTQTPQIQSGITMIDGAVNRALPAPVAGASVNPMQIWIFIGSIIWITGLLVLLIYSVFATLRLLKKLKSATHLYDNIYKIDTIEMPFVFGLINPRIYLPNNLSEAEKPYIIRHEQTHIKRKDHIIKFAAFLITSVHWFNPLVWLAFYLMGEDMELSCDELVIKEMGNEIKGDYSDSLLTLSVGKKIIGGSPIAFGENNTKGRIKNILNYKKPKFWVVAAAIIVVLALAIGLLSSPADGGNMYKIDETKVVRISKQIFPVGSIEDLEGGLWSVLINNINDAKWRNLSEEDYPGEDDIVLNMIITLERDESVENKEYILAIYCDEDKNVLGKEQKYSLALAYDDLTGDIKVWSLPDNLYGKIKNFLNLPDMNKTVEDYAWEYIDREIEMFESTDLNSVKIIDKKITRLEKLSSFDNILSSTVELWRLEYRLKPEDPSKVMLAGGMQMIDGWITEDGSMGKPNLIFAGGNDDLVYLGSSFNFEFGTDTLASQETAIRVTLENRGLLPNETYKGNHVVIKFPLSTGETSQLLLSQPVIQGNKGIWTVERWMDGNGAIYHGREFLHYEEDIRIQDYYEKLQEKSDRGENRELLDPIEAGYDYIINTLGQILVKRSDLEIINPATIDDFRW